MNEMGLFLQGLWKYFIFMGVCLLGVLAHAAINKGFSWKDAVFMGVCLLGVLVYKFSS